LLRYNLYREEPVWASLSALKIYVFEDICIGVLIYASTSSLTILSRIRPIACIISASLASRGILLISLILFVLSPYITASSAFIKSCWWFICCTSLHEPVICFIMSTFRTLICFWYKVYTFWIKFN